MPLTMQRVSPGLLSDAYQEESNRLRAGEAVHKIWAKQPGLWKDDAEHARIIANRLGWISVLDSMRAEAPALAGSRPRDRRIGRARHRLAGHGRLEPGPGGFLADYFPRRRAALFCAGLDRSGGHSASRARRSTSPTRCSSSPASPAKRSRRSRNSSISTTASLRRDLLRQAAASSPSPIAALISTSLAGEYSFRLHLSQSRRHRRPLFRALLFWAGAGGALGRRYRRRAGLAPWRCARPAARMADADANPALQLGSLLGAAARRGDDKLFLLSTPEADSAGQLDRTAHRGKHGQRGAWNRARCGRRVAASSTCWRGAA